MSVVRIESSLLSRSTFVIIDKLLNKQDPIPCTRDEYWAIRTFLLPMSNCYDLCFLFRVVNGLYDCDFSHQIKLLEFDNPRTRSQCDSRKLIVQLNRTRGADKFFTTNAPKIWNKLPAQLRQLTPLSKKSLNFKAALKKFYFENFCNWNINSLCTWITCCQCNNCLS